MRLALLLLIGCTSAGLRVPHAPTAAAPCWAGGSRCVSTTVDAIIDAPPDEVFDYVVAEDVLPKVLHAYGPVPSVTGTTILRGPWGQVGALRIVHAGGGTVRETITHFDRSRFFAYRIFDFHNPLGAFANLGVGYWTFERLGASTRVHWTYAFAPRSLARQAPLALFVAMFYRGYMRNALDEIKRQVAAHRSARQ